MAAPKRIRVCARLAAVGALSLLVEQPLYRLVRLAQDLEAAGFFEAAIRCRRAVLKRAPDRVHVVEPLLLLYLRRGRFAEAEQLFLQFTADNRLTIGFALAVLGQCCLVDNPALFTKAYRKLVAEYGESFGALAPSVISEQASATDGLHQLVLEYSKEDSQQRRVPCELLLAIARLCFAFQEYRTAAMLFAAADGKQPLGEKDCITAAFARLRVDPAQGPVPTFRLVSPAHCPEGDWLLLNAQVLMAADDDAGARQCLERFIRNRHSERKDCEALVSEAVQALAALARLRGGLTVSKSPGEDDSLIENAIPKIFIGGFGWSGSGALYDALCEFDGFVEFPAVETGQLLHEDAGNEMTFVQGRGGLGAAWRNLRNRQVLPWLDCWDLFRLHAIGGGFVGYAERKSALMTSNLVEHFGSRYLAVFRQFFEQIALTANGGEGKGAKAIFQETTESLCRLLEPAGDHQVLFNNAVFGRNVDMLEIFVNFKAAFVYRDPRDVYADRKVNDRYHWRSAEQFARFYRKSLQRYFVYKNQAAGVNANFCDVSFERFVLESSYRKQVLDWLLRDKVYPRAAQRFFPEDSRRNIGQHQAVLTDEELVFFQGHDEDVEMIRSMIAPSLQATRTGG